MARDALAEYLDREKGGEITDHSIFNEHSKKYENEFFEDMAVYCNNNHIKKSKKRFKKAKKYNF